MAFHEYGPKGHIVDVFNDHLRAMTRDDWEAIFNAYLCSDDAYVKHAAAITAGAARVASGNLNWFYAANEARDITRSAVVKGETDIAGENVVRFAMYAVDEILASDLFRTRNQPFYFLPMFGFADETQIPVKEFAA
jgi:hypothetical protein